MNAIEAVVEVVKANEELMQTVDTYDEWFESLVGKTVTITRQSKNSTRFVMAEVEEFEPGEGWLARDVETDDVFELTFHDLVSGRVWVERAPAPKSRPKRHVKFTENVE